MSRSTEGTPDARVAGIASKQAGCVSRAQALTAGLTDNMIHHRLEVQRWSRLHPGVYHISGVPHSWHQDIWAATLAVGPQAVVSHHTALLLHGLPYNVAPRRPLTLSVPGRQHHRVAGAKVHQRSDLGPHHITLVDGIRTTGIERSIVDLAGVTKSPAHVGGVLDRFIADRRTTLIRVSSCFEEIARPGKRGMKLLATILDERGPGYVPPESRLEEMLFDVLAGAGLPEPCRQVPLPGRGKVDGRADAGYLDARILLEADGKRWHSRLADYRRDRERDAEASRAGWVTLRFSYDQLRDEPDEVGATVRDTRTVRLQQLAGRSASCPSEPTATASGSGLRQ